ncbi:MAG TPA: urease accessory UreF family protein [Stellaceae bacterium]|nr:urease accessory UreF family protein [Stellaceae bacterium]
MTTGLYRLLAWSSPAFPIGAFSYSHGLEAAAASGAIKDRDTLQQWVAAIVLRGSGRIDADILRDAHRVARSGDDAALAEVNRRGIAYRSTAELSLESGQQGTAFLNTCRAAWPEPFVADWDTGGDICHAAAFGATAAGAGVALEDALLAYLQAFTANLVSAGIRLGIVGQTGGQRILAALEAPITVAVTETTTRDPDQFGSATFAADLASMAHETQYTRLFRS